MKRKDFIRLGGLGAIAGTVPLKAGSPAEGGKGPHYSSRDGDHFLLEDAGKPWRHADGDTPVVLQGNTQPWNFSNVNILRQGRKKTDFPPCNIYWATDMGRFDAGVIDRVKNTHYIGKELADFLS